MTAGRTSPVPSSFAPPSASEFKHEKNKVSSSSVMLREAPFDVKQLPRPSKNKLRTQLVRRKALPAGNSAHSVEEVIEETDKEIRTLFLKINSANSVMSEMEAAIAGIYRLIAPRHVPEMYAVYQINNETKKEEYIGVASEEIPDFVTTEEKPLTEEDFNVDFIDEKTITFDLMDQLDDELYALEDKQRTCLAESRKLNKLQYKMGLEIRKFAVANQENLQQTELEAKKLNKERQKISATKNAIDETLLENRLNIAKFYQRIEQQHKISAKQFKNFRTVKGLAIGWASRYLLAEHDLHRKNWTNTGFQFDFDMSLWPLTHHFKEGSSGYLRAPDKATFIGTPKDIVNFPDITDAQPFYWPTTQPNGNSSSNAVQDYLQKLSTEARGYFSAWLASKPYKTKENELYKKLKNNKAMQHYKFFPMAKFILLISDILHENAQMHMRVDCPFDSSKLLMPAFISCIIERIDQFKRCLHLIPEFAEFYKTQGEKCLTELLTTIKQQGHKTTDISEESFRDDKSVQSRQISPIEEIRQNHEKMLQAINKHEEDSDSDDEQKVSITVSDRAALTLSLATKSGTMFATAATAPPPTPASVASAADFKDISDGVYDAAIKEINAMVKRRDQSTGWTSALASTLTLGFFGSSPEESAIAKIKALIPGKKPANKRKALQDLYNVLETEKKPLGLDSKVNQEITRLLILLSPHGLVAGSTVNINAQHAV